jgi:hypothetical protein
MALGVLNPTVHNVRKCGSLPMLMIEGISDMQSSMSGRPGDCYEIAPEESSNSNSAVSQVIENQNLS